ncbi:MAG: hypothetical protein ACOX60_06245 [Massiliimalia sp.]
MPKVSSHSGLPENVELKRIAEKYESVKIKRDIRLSAIYQILDKMSDFERNMMIAEIIRHYKKGCARNG